MDTSLIKNKLDSRLQKAIHSFQLDNALSLTDSIIIYAKKEHDSLFMAYGYDSKATLYKLKKRLPKAREAAINSIIIYEALNSKESMVNGYCLLSDIYLAYGKPDSSNIYLNKAQKFITDSTIHLLKNKYYNCKSILFSKQGRIDSSLHYTFKRIALLKGSNHYNLGNGYLELASIFIKVHDYKKALLYIDKALEQFHNSTDELPITISKAFLLKGQILYQQGDYISIDHLIDSALKQIKGRTLNDLEAQLYILKIKYLYAIGKNHKAKAYIANPIFSNSEISSLTLFDYYFLLLQQTSDTDLVAIKVYLNKLETLKKNISSINKKLNYNQLISTHLYNTGNYKKAYKAQEQYFQLSKIANNRQQTYSVYDLENKYQLSKKDEKIAIQQLKIEQKENQFKISIYSSLLVIIIGLGFISHYRQRQKIKTKEIETLKTQRELVRLEALIDGEEKERMRIAQDLHDGINGDLSVIKYKITSLNENKLNINEKNEFNTAINMLDNAIDQVRHISHNLAPPSLQNFNLIEAIQQYCTNASSTNNLTITFQHYGEYCKLKIEIETIIYRMLQELINNIIKHANASEALVQINNHNDIMHIIVEDNGVGFNISKKHKGLGLKNIDSRVSFLNADYTIDTNTNGTTVHIDINLKHLNYD